MTLNNQFNFILDFRLARHQLRMLGVSPRGVFARVDIELTTPVGEPAKYDGMRGVKG